MALGYGCDQKCWCILRRADEPKALSAECCVIAKPPYGGRRYAFPPYFFDQHFYLHTSVMGLWLCNNRVVYATALVGW